MFEKMGLSNFDDKGIPLSDVHGKLIEKNQRKKFEKLYSTQFNNFNSFQEKLKKRTRIFSTIT